MLPATGTLMRLPTTATAVRMPARASLRVVFCLVFMVGFLLKENLENPV